MTFVNNVARIVHEEVTRWGGLCNKNLGNAFQLVISVTLGCVITLSKMIQPDIYYEDDSVKDYLVIMRMYVMQDLMAKPLDQLLE